ncbi:hypothetical protein A2671_01970 [Candidatus Kaiserbacteria bacterium RIFCSPHIGHO2_01_FULL_49_13]|uniref:Uncharacterized protein n=1 Tax=Candidatus Kaiserbacteria bacterium RIFCSPHIGHO2_01_FULL_49_13 TaxID=1798477 RepID=A0A1F6CD79_9BACT|nr:MAG: hypothetical protein A2671_01970 [Candidatus Kaiserbacteria bacterium RIFCSPHIGHO2_01_FULL_49_13]
MDTVEELSKEISEKTWSGQFWGSQGAVELERRRFNLSKREGGEASAFGAASSTYYAAAGNAYARFKKAPWQFWWAYRAFILRGYAVWLSDQIELKKGVTNMTPDELDVRQSILRRVKRYKEAKKCVHEALGRKNVARHTKALLLIGQIDLEFNKPSDKYESVGDSARDRARSITQIESWLEQAEKCAYEVRSSNPHQAARIFRNCAMWRDRLNQEGRAEVLRRQASDLADIRHLKDQRLKIDARL